jgi:hypothetical protein
VPVTKDESKSPYWQIRFEIAGVEVRRSSRTKDKRAAQRLEEKLRRDLWQQIESGEKRWTWNDAVAKFTLEKSGQASWERTERDIKVLNEYLTGELLKEIDYEALLKIRALLELRTCNGNGWKTKRQWKKSTCNRVLAIAGSILGRCATDEWKFMLLKHRPFRCSNSRRSSLSGLLASRRIRSLGASRSTRAT